MTNFYATSRACKTFFSHFLKHLALPLALLLPFMLPAQQIQTVTFTYSGAPDYFTVPPCVDTLYITAAGAQGGGSTGANGATVTSVVPVTPNAILQINVGGMGGVPAGGWNGGGAGSSASTASYASGGGGGATDVRMGAYTLADRILVAAGGGGAGGGTTLASGGSGGCTTGATGVSSFGSGAGGGTQTAGGNGGAAWISSGNAGGSGTLGIGGNGGSDPCYNLGPGGGGGGGYYGGGGGGSDCFASGSLGGGGGAGGSSLGGSCVSNNNSGNGYLTISYTLTISDSTSTIASNTGPYCEGETIYLNYNDSVYGQNPTYTWTGPNAYISNAQNDSIPNATPADSGWYVMTMKADSGCFSAKTLVVVHHKDSTTWNDTLCEGQSMEFNGITYTESVYGVKDTFPNIFGCDSVVTLNLTVNPKKYRTETIFKCYEDLPFTWNGIEVPFGSVTNDSFALYTTPSLITGCDSITNLHLTVSPEPAFIRIDSFPCGGYVYKGNFYEKDSVFYDTVSSVVTHCDSMYWEYHFVIDSFKVTVFSDPDTPYQDQPVTLYTKTNTYDYITTEWQPYTAFPNQNAKTQHAQFSEDELIVVTAQDVHGCISTDTLHLKIIPLNTAPGVPSAFSPNGDGLNDLFRIRFPEEGTYTYASFTVYNRYGHVVYSSENNPNAAWDGTENGKPCAVGVYFYHIKVIFLNNQQKIFKGDVTLLR